ncbi:outer membrane beta-barrel protein [uncultured Roseibium sp.]|uniref:outer membrane protein n=1 Tax=uncultured Roseibium sp. TaxID=1936171 RepID=UPI0026117841|nr:outer membrane beta-barrel protein [uncultured Roseibium sp.]
MQRSFCYWLWRPAILCTVLGVLMSGAYGADLNSSEQPTMGIFASGHALWAGPYLGFEGGIAQTVTDVKANNRTEELSHVNAAFGLYGGYNWEVSRVVLGVEAAASYLGGTEKGDHPTLGPVEARASWTAAAKARAGLPIGNFMPYLSAGIAATEHSLTANGKEETSVSIGPVVGAGLEVALKDRWRVRADYSLTGIIDDTSRFGGADVERMSGNQRLMLGISRSF